MGSNLECRRETLIRSSNQMELIVLGMIGTAVRLPRTMWKFRRIPGLQNSLACGVVSGGTSKPVVSFRMGKKGIIESTDHVWMSRIGHQGADFDAIFDCESALDVLSNGFVVRKSQNLLSNPSLELEEYEEFVLEVPHRLVLLFLTENALSIDEVKAAEFKVRNLILLDGTWVKAKRMYSENPWLKLLAHLKLDLEVMSLTEKLEVSLRLDVCPLSRVPFRR